MKTNIVTQVNYSLKEKYFHIEPEMRIRRYQYFVRILIPGILFGLASMLLIAPLSGLILVATFSGWGETAIAGLVILIAVLGLLSSFLMYKIGLNLVTKRCHDFGSDGKIARLIMAATFIISALTTILGLISHFTSVLETVSTLTASISNILGIPAFIMVIILLFRPGIAGDNSYGKDPINTKVGFLG